MKIVYFQIRLLGQVVMLVFLLASFSWAATYYVDVTSGKDTNSGLSSATAWGTIARVNTSKFQPGDNILFKRGCIWREQLTVPSSGSAGNQIIFGTYGTGDAPIIDASNLIVPGTSWASASSASIWTAVVSTEPNIVFFNGAKGIRSASQATCTSARKWFWAANVLSVYSDTDPDSAYTTPGIEVGARATAIYNEKNYISINGLKVQRSNDLNLGNIFSSGNHVTITGCDSSWSSHNGIIFVGSGDNLLTLSNIHDNGTKLSSSGVFGYKDTGSLGHENYISYNNIYNNYSYGIQLLSNYYIVEHNDVYDNGNTEYMGIGIEFIDWDNSGYAQHNVVRYNKVHGQKSALNNGEGIDFDDYSSHNIAYYNISYGNDGPGYTMWRSNNNTFTNNVSYGNCLNSGGALTSKTEFNIDADGANLTDNNVVKNNIAVATQANTYAIWVGPYSYNSSGLNITNNDWYTTSTNWYFWNITSGNNLATWNAFTGVGTDLNSDPHFVSTSDYHLQTNSPCINAGTDVGLSQDYQGQKVPIDNVPDIGAYEFLNSSPPKNLRSLTP